MVTASQVFNSLPGASASIAYVVAQSNEQQLPIQQLDPGKRVAVLMAILGLMLLGGFLVVAIMLGGRWVRRQKLYERAEATIANQQNPPSTEPQSEVPDVSTGDTMVTKPHDQTKIDE